MSAKQQYDDATIQKIIEEYDVSDSVGRKALAARLGKRPKQLRTNIYDWKRRLLTTRPGDATDVADVQYGAVGEFDRLPDGYAKTIQPMRPYSEAEEFALQESMRLYGFLGAIVRDQYGRILDGNQRQRIARLRGLGVPYTITHVKDDAHAMEIARTANVIRRHYTREQREQIALAMRDQGFSYRLIAVALGVSKDTVQRDISGGFTIIPEQDARETPGVSHETPAPQERVRGRDGKSYLAKRPSAPKPPTLEGDDEPHGKFMALTQAALTELEHRLAAPDVSVQELLAIRDEADQWQRLCAEYTIRIQRRIAQLLSTMPQQA
jgi:DNA-binding CsgD family transcriptional regulator